MDLEFEQAMARGKTINTVKFMGFMFVIGAMVTAMFYGLTLISPAVTTMIGS